ncbi:MAG TPA: GNAT family N-acetyltransferase [Conexibacter sp.]|jgi:GNAT superfamily N-acetyltransferase|nr:GNAT family N-acetyltransferase [Conexibacter sp.]
MADQRASDLWRVRPVEHGDWDDWRRLFGGYCDFYRWPTSEQHQRLIWSWIHDAKSIEALVAVPSEQDGPAVGLAHLRSWVRPLRGIVCGYLDDLFVDPQTRSMGVVDALFEAIDAIAVERGWAVVRWTTADDNYRARTAYDRVATRTGWITYDMTPGRPAPPIGD